jgi:hypothetical protein
VVGIRLLQLLAQRPTFCAQPTDNPAQAVNLSVELLVVLVEVFVLLEQSPAETDKTLLVSGRAG